MNTNKSSQLETEDFATTSSNMDLRPMITSKPPSRVMLETEGPKFLVPKNAEQSYTTNVMRSSDRLHGYTIENSQTALSKFQKRSLIILDNQRIRNSRDVSPWDEVERWLVEKFISVPSIQKTHTHFFGEGLSYEEADKKCSLKVVEELYQFDVIKEIGIEFNTRRKVIVDPSKALDLKLSCYLNSSTEFFSNKMDELADKKQLFY